MKKILLLQVCIWFSIAAYSQKIHFTDTSNVWKELEPEYNAPNPWILNYSTYSFIRDSTIGTVKYKWFNFDYGTCLGCGSFVREDTNLNKVYIRNVTGDSDMVFMDYNLNIWDTFTTLYNRFVVIKIDSTLINAVWHRIWYFPPIVGGIYGSDTLYFIEGVGCIQHPTYMFRDFSGCVECSQPFMYCFSNNAITPPISPPVSFLDNTTSCSTFPTLYVNQLQSSDHIFLFPNPATTQLTIQFNHTVILSGAEGNQITITNLLGQNVYNQSCNSLHTEIDVAGLPTGVYFIKVNGGEVRRFLKE